MGFFSGIRRRIKKLIPKEVRPFIPYAAAAIPGLAALGPIGGAFTKASLARLATDDEADIKDALRTGIIAAAPQALSQGLGKFASSGIGNVPGVGPLQADATGMQKFLQGAKGFAGDLSQSGKLNPEFKYGNLMDTAKTVGAQSAVDMGIQAAELNEDALADYNRMLAEQGIADKAGRRAAIRAIYSNTGTWDMDEVDSMLDTYGYRTGGRVGYAEGSYVPRDQIEDSYDIIEKMDNELNPGIIDQIPFIGGYEGKYPVDKDQGSIMIDEIQDYKYGQPPGSFNSSGEIPERAPMSMEQTIKVLEDKYDQAVEEGYGLGEFESMGVYSKDDIRRRVELGYDSAKSNMSNTGIMRAAKGGRVGLKDGGFDMEAFEEGFKYAKEGLESLEEAEDEIKPLPIRELRLADGGKVSELKAAYQRYLEMARKDGSKKIIPFEIFAEEFARENFARGGITDINMEEQIDTPSGDMMMDENVEVASNPEVMDSLNELSLMLFRRPLDQLSEDEYEELKDFAGQTSLKPGLIDEYRNYKYNAEEQGQTPMSPRDYFRMEFGAARLGVKKGGPIELNINVGGNNMEDIKGQTAGPDWYYDRIQALEFEFGDELTDDEIADIAFDSDKFYDKMGYEPGDYKKGGRVGFESGDYVGSSKNETLDQEYDSYIKEIEIDGDKPMSFSSFKKMIAQDYKKGGKVIELMPKGILYKGKAKDYPGIKQLIKDMKKKGTRPKKAEGGLMNLGGKEMDLRGGGFVPMGAKERADDVPARLSKNEFVMTADAVRGAGGGSVQKGADLMYDQMKRLEGQA